MLVMQLFSQQIQRSFIRNQIRKNVMLCKYQFPFPQGLNICSFHYLKKKKKKSIIFQEKWSVTINLCISVQKTNKQTSIARLCCAVVVPPRIIEQPMLEDTSKKHQVQPFMGKRSQDEINTLSNCILKTSKHGKFYVFLGRFQRLIDPILKNFFLFFGLSFQDKATLNATCTHCPLSSPCASLDRESLCSLCSHSLSTGITKYWNTRSKDLTSSLLQ